MLPGFCREIYELLKQFETRTGAHELFENSSTFATPEQKCFVDTFYSNASADEQVYNFILRKRCLRNDLFHYNPAGWLSPDGGNQPGKN
jgi:hypothetical protein